MRGKRIPSDRKCCNCGETCTDVRILKGRIVSLWHYNDIDYGYLCHRCYLLDWRIRDMIQNMGFESYEYAMTEEYNYDDASGMKLIFLLSSNLTSREKHILSRRFGLDGRGKTTFEEISSELYLTKQRIHKLFSDSIKKMKRAAHDRFGKKMDEQLIGIT